MNDFDYLGENEVPVERIKSQIMINIIEGKQYYKNNVNTYVTVEIPSYFRSKTAIRKSTTTPSYFKKSIVDLPSLLLNDLLSMYIKITVYESHNFPPFSKTVLGRAILGIATLWSEPGRSFRSKWLTLVDRGKNEFRIKGYLKCDFFMFYEHKSVDNPTASKPLGSTIEDVDIDENNLLIPDGYKKPTTYLARYSIKIFKGEIESQLVGAGPKWLSIYFGIAPETSILLNMNKTELNWNREYSTVNVYPPLCPIIMVRIVLSGNIVASRTLSVHEMIGEDGIPGFGPAFLHFSLLETGQYFGRISLSVETELVPPEIESITSLQIDSAVDIPNENLIYHEIIIIGLIFRVSRVHEKRMKSNGLSISMDYGEYNLSTEHERKNKHVNIQTPAYEGIRVEKDYYRLSIKEDTKPCLFLVINLPSAEYYSMFAANLLFTTVNNMDTCILKTTKYLKADSQESKKTGKKKIFHKMLIKLSLYYQRFRNLYDDNKIMRKHVHASCVNYLKSLRNFFLKEIGRIDGTGGGVYNELEMFSSMKKMRETIKLVRQKNKSYYGPPDICLNLCDGKKILSKCRIRTRNFLHSNIPEFKGKFCGRTRPWFLRATEKNNNLFDEIAEAVFWIGPYKDFRLRLSKIPGLVFNECGDDSPCSQYGFKLYDETLLRFKAHISQAALSENFYKRYGRLNLMARVIFNGRSMATEAIDSSFSLSWNVSISFEPIACTRYRGTDGGAHTIAVVQLCHVPSETEEPIGNVVAYTVIGLEENIDTAVSRETLVWFDVLGESEKIGKICMAVEVAKATPDEPTEIAAAVDDLRVVVPLLKNIRPKLRVYRLAILFWGLREIQSDLNEPFVRTFYSDSFVDSDVIKNVKSFPNFPDMADKKYELDIELPEDPSFMPSMSFQLFNKIKKQHLPIGMCASKTMDHFLVPTISDSEWNRPEKDNPAHSRKENNRDDEKTEKINNNIISNKATFSFDCVWFKKIINYIDSSNLKKIFLWIFKYVMLVLNVLNDTVSCLCPCLSTAALWTLKQLKHFVGKFGKKYDTLSDEFNDDEKEFNWWTKYYGFQYKNESKSKKNNTFVGAFLKILCKFLPNRACCKDESKKTYDAKHNSKTNQTITIFDKELEKIAEFERFEDNIKKFQIYGLGENRKIPTTVATLKGDVRLYPKTISKDGINSEETHSPREQPQIWPRPKSNARCNVIVRVYVLKANNLHPSDINGLSDPYVEILFGRKHRISDKKNRVSESLNPVFGRCYEKEISFPECSTLKIKIMDYDRFKSNELIGETIIDIESRYFSKHRAHCGLPKQYNKEGYNRWRDSESPSQILHKLCLLHSLTPPTYAADAVIVGSTTFRVRGENAKTDVQSLALHVLNRWQEMPVIGYRLVPEHVETRTLSNPKSSNMHQGTLEMWIDMFSKSDDRLPETVDVKPPIVENYELRVIVWSVTDVKLMDSDLFTGEKHTDIYIKGWLPGIAKQSTDVHYRSLNGEGLFNWRFKFAFPYNKTENIIVRKTHNNLFSMDGEEDARDLPRLHLQIWDNDQLSPDSYIGFLTLDLWDMPRGTKLSWRCTASDDVPRIDLFKVKKTRGWWPFVSTENHVNSIVGKVDVEIEIMTKAEADKSPAGSGRNKPQPLPVPKRPSVQFLRAMVVPFTFMFRNLIVAHKSNCISGAIVVCLILFLMMFVYSIPGYTVKKILNA